MYRAADVNGPTASGGRGATATIGLGDMPPEILAEVASRCLMSDLASLGLASRRMRDAATDPVARSGAFTHETAACPLGPHCAAHTTDVVDAAFIASGLSGVGCPMAVSAGYAAVPDWVCALAARFIGRSRRTAALYAESRSWPEPCRHMPPSMTDTYGVEWAHRAQGSATPFVFHIKGQWGYGDWNRARALWPMDSPGGPVPPGGFVIYTHAPNVDECSFEARMTLVDVATRLTLELLAEVPLASATDGAGAVWCCVGPFVPLTRHEGDEETTGRAFGRIGAVGGRSDGTRMAGHITATPDEWATTRWLLDTIVAVD